MPEKEFEQYRKELMDLVAMGEHQAHKEAKLKDLARKVGASTLSHGGPYNAGEPELIDNINDALRTEAMILACKTASRHFKISIMAAIASLVSALAAWTAILWEFKS